MSAINVATLKRALRIVATYAFVPFVFLVRYVNNEIGLDDIVDETVLAGFAIAIGFYIVTPKTLFRTIYFNFLMIWFCVGTCNFMVFRLIWLGREFDILLYNRLCALFMVTYSATSYLLGRRVAPVTPGPITDTKIDIRVASKICVVMIVLYTLLVLPSVGWTGVFGGALTNENRFTVEVNPLVPRLSLAFPFLICLLTYRLGRSEVRLSRVIAFIAIAFPLTTIMGARFAFFQMLVTGGMFALFSGNIGLLKKHKVAVTALAAGLMVMQIFIVTIRSGGSLAEESAASTTSLIYAVSAWGGEHRDAAAAMVMVSEEERKVISDNYLPSVIFPLIPDPFLRVVGLDKNATLQGGGAYVLQQVYDDEFGTQRMGGIAEAYFWLGNLGVIIVGFINGLAAVAIDRVAHRRGKKTFASVAFAAYGSVWLFYFVASQSNMLLGGIGAFIVMYYVLAILTRNRKLQPASP
jgi:hypothetical protein